jgi:transposase
VEWIVEWDLEHRQLDGIESIGVDEIYWGHGMKGDNFLTVIYQIDAGCRRLLWIGKRRTEKTLRQGLKTLGQLWLKACALSAATCGDPT